MKELKKDLAYLWKHREAVVGLIILLALIFSGLALITLVIEETL